MPNNYETKGEECSKPVNIRNRNTFTDCHQHNTKAPVPLRHSTILKFNDEEDDGISNSTDDEGQPVLLRHSTVQKFNHEEDDGIFDSTDDEGEPVLLRRNTILKSNHEEDDGIFNSTDEESEKENNVKYIEPFWLGVSALPWSFFRDSSDRSLNKFRNDNTTCEKNSNSSAPSTGLSVLQGLNNNLSNIPLPSSNC